MYGVGGWNNGSAELVDTVRSGLKDCEIATLPLTQRSTLTTATTSVISQIAAYCVAIVSPDARRCLFHPISHSAGLPLTLVC